MTYLHPIMIISLIIILVQIILFITRGLLKNLKIKKVGQQSFFMQKKEKIRKNFLNLIKYLCSGDILYDLFYHK